MHTVHCSTGAVTTTIQEAQLFTVRSRAHCSVFTTARSVLVHSLLLFSYLDAVSVSENYSWQSSKVVLL